ncbi:MAG: 30S ribosomal protein S18 [bacterium]
MIFKKKKKCRFCINKLEEIDYKEVERLKGYLNERGLIFSRKNTGNCARHQRQLTTAIKRARYLALLSYMSNK